MGQSLKGAKKTGLVVSGVKKHGVWSIRASKDGVKHEMNGVLSIQAYQCMAPSYLRLGSELANN